MASQKDSQMKERRCDKQDYQKNNARYILKAFDLWEFSMAKTA